MTRPGPAARGSLARCLASADKDAKRGAEE